MERMRASFLEKDTGDSSGSGPGGSSARSLAPTAAFAARCDAEAAFDLKRFAARSAATLAPDAFAPDAFAPLDDEGASAAPVSSLGVDEAKGSSLDISGGRRRSQ